MNKNIIYLLLFAILAGGAYYAITFVLDLKDSLSGLSKQVREDTHLFQKRMADEKIYGEDIWEILPVYYNRIRKEIMKTPKIVPSQIKKSEGQIAIQVGGGILRFEDHQDKNCQACIIKHEVAGEIPSMKKLLINTFYYKSSTCQILDLKTGQIDTLHSIPAISPDSTWVATDNFLGQDTLTMGLNIYKIEGSDFVFLNQVGETWITKEFFWNEKNDIFAKVHLVKDKIIEYDSVRHIVINKNAFLRTQ